MQKNSVMKKMMVGAMIGTMILTATAVGFADDVATKTVRAGKGKPFGIELNGKMEFRGQFGAGGFEKLVEAGIVSQEKADAMKNYMEAQVQERKAAFESIKDLSQEERNAYLEENKGERLNHYDQMVKAGVISEEESAKIKEYLKDNASFGPRVKRDGTGFETVLAKLVEEGKLKEDSSKAIQEYMKAQAEAKKEAIDQNKRLTREERKAEMEKIKNLRDEEKKAYFEANKKERVDIFEKMVEAGVISADEAKIIKESMPQRKNLN